MTRRRPPLTQIYLSSVSYRALDFSLRLGAKRAYAPSVPVLGLLARIGLWFRIVFSGVFGNPVAVCVDSRAPTAPLNRTHRRRKRRSLSLARRADRLADIILRRYGYARFLQWIYNRTLTPRTRWCFFAWNWAWRPRITFLGCEQTLGTVMRCAAPLRPD